MGEKKGQAKQEHALNVDLTSEEQNTVRELLGREPNDVEWGMIDIMWSEHCSYKSSRPSLSLLPTKGERVLLGPGFDSGIVDIGGGWGVAFKIETHNHPSAIEPYGGSATGIGGIVRDILAVGAFPACFLDSLHFGSLSSPHSQWLFRYVVKGVGDYGNCIGVPTTAGEIQFDESFERNCLVNVACAGFVKHDEIVKGDAKDAGDTMILVGGSTGRDGVHGVTFASRNLDEASDDDRPAVQIPDPFTKKLIIDACAEAYGAKLVKAMKDLGGGGLTCASSEMAHKGKKGARIDISKVMVREKGMANYEIMLSESQERMLFSTDKIRLDKLLAIFKKYSLPHAIIGEITTDKNLVVMNGDEQVACLPTHILAEVPVVNREKKKPKEEKEKPNIPEPMGIEPLLFKMLSSENICSRRWVYQQYDHEVGDRSALKAGKGDAAVMLSPNGGAIALTSDSNSNHCFLDPYEGSIGVMAEALRNITCTGARAISIVDNLSFGNPKKPEVFWSFHESVRGIADAAKAFETPCVGGNVSFYNEDEVTKLAIKPAPVIVMLGMMEKRESMRSPALKEGDAIVILGTTKPEMGGSEYHRIVHRTLAGEVPKSGLALEKKTADFVLSHIEKISSLHDCSKGGLLVALSKMCIAGNIGAEVDSAKIVSKCNRFDELAFSESHSRYIIGTTEPEALVSEAKKAGIAASVVGKAGGRKFSVGSYSWDVSELYGSWEYPMWKAMGGKP
ncbi:MAG: phosphoribosylformylglycinamidine synthase subunit PurL [Candidatus Micrarchaeota archaeon]